MAKNDGFVKLARATLARWWNDNPFRYAAALAYYTLFSLAPLLVIAVALAGLAFGEEAVRGEVVGQIRGLVGPKTAESVQMAIAAAAPGSSGIFASVVGIVALMLGASAVFAELQDALNTIWRAESDASTGLRRVAWKRLLSLAMVAVIGFLLLVSLAASALVNAMGTYFTAWLPIPALLIELVNLTVSVAVITVLFAAIYKVLPDVEIEWSDVWVGAAVTSVLFTIGKSAIGIYLGQSAVGSTYGAAGSLMTLLVWVYYSALIVLLGAEFTFVYAHRRRSRMPVATRDVPLKRIAPDLGEAPPRSDLIGDASDWRSTSTEHR